jgi:hypothetical protein
MKLKYVGALPIVSSRGVSFDQTKPDRYTFLNAAVELLEALSSESTEERKITLNTSKEKEYGGSELVELLKKHCKDMETVFASREEKTNELIEEYISKIKANDRISADERKAWLGNVAAMRDYYLQYITNENAYKCALHALADKIHESHIEEIVFPLGRNHGLVLSHLVPVLTDHKPPYDATLSIIEKNGETFGKLDMNRSRSLSV